MWNFLYGAVWLWMILKNKVIFETLLLSPRLSHPSMFMRRLVSVLLIAPEQIRAAVRWQLSSLILSPIEQLSNRAEPYSRTGLIIVLYMSIFCLFNNCLFNNCWDCPEPRFREGEGKVASSWNYVWLRHCLFPGFINLFRIFHTCIRPRARTLNAIQHENWPSRFQRSPRSVLPGLIVHRHWNIQSCYPISRHRSRLDHWCEFVDIWKASPLTLKRGQVTQVAYVYYFGISYTSCARKH